MVITVNKENLSERNLVHMYILKPNGCHSEEKDQESVCRYLKMEERKLRHKRVRTDCSINGCQEMDAGVPF